MSEAIIRVVLVDDHRVVREGFAALIALEQDLVVVGQAGSCVQARELVADLKPDLVLLDVVLADGDGIACIRDFTRGPTPSAVLMLSSFASEENVFRALQCGALGYVLKTTDADEVLTAIRAVAHGSRWLSSELAATLSRRDGKSPLSDREREVLRMVANGLSNEALALALNITVSTAKTHIYRIMQKLGAKNRTDAVAKARSTGIVPS
jgi:DNA-binding NarL/FixJ family response regulator